MADSKSSTSPMTGVSGAHFFHRKMHNVTLIPVAIRSNYSKVEFSLAGPIQVQLTRAHPLVNNKQQRTTKLGGKIGTHDVHCPCSPYPHIIILVPISSSIVFFFLPLSPSIVPLSSGLKPFPEGSGEQGTMGEEGAGGIDV